ncbi:SDR family oxidoreductase [Jeotgalibacillus aurantiacus]|uniref:SDR family oxidoreductase n=1 Tax=Jeotgalibacillus aurantiacus TaxID=2763266 RepID=UPI001D09F237|nr:SDR family oxidoreductase [Jeotgalibacillus aurantiacus]
MKTGYFVTGFPGFLSEQLLKEWISGSGSKSIYLLVMPSMQKQASERLEELKKINESESVFHIVQGDITKPELGMTHSASAYLKDKIHYVWHLAAVYDLAVPKSTAFQVNVTGTHHVNEWVRTLPNIRRYVYFSTAYVAGKRNGVIKETELIRPDAFRNHYEHSKFEAEVLVEKMKSEVPVTIIRPAIVKGSTKSGDTTKFDGPYYLMNIIDKVKSIPVIPYMGKSSAKLNVVPYDYVIQAANYLAHLPEGEGKTYHLTDPNPYPAREVYRFIMQEQAGRTPSFTMPVKAVQLTLSIPSVRKYIKAEKEGLDYFFWEAEFDQSQSEKDLRQSGIECPDFLKAIPSMVRFYEENKHDKRFHREIK